MVSTGMTSDACITLQSENKRIEKWDIVRALLIFSVVLGHFINRYVDDSETMRALFLFIYSFHMPCFLFLDGLFSKRTINEKRYNHVFSYLVLGLFIKILNALVNGLLDHRVSFSLLDKDGSYWYAICLFNCCLLTMFLKRFSKKWVLISSVILACFVGYDNSLGDYLVLFRTVIFFPVFFAGYCIDPKKLAEAASNIKAKVGGLIILATVAFVCLRFEDKIYFLRALLTGRNSYQAFASYGMDDLVYYGAVLRLIYYFATGIICLSVISVLPAHLPRMKWVANIGRRSLQIYILHTLVISILYKGFHLEEFIMSHGISHLIIIFVAFVVTLLLSARVLEKPIKTVVYPSIHVKISIVEGNDTKIKKEGNV